MFHKNSSIIVGHPNPIAHYLRTYIKEKSVATLKKMKSCYCISLWTYLKEIQIAGLGSLVSWKGDQIFGLQQRFSVDLIEFLVSRDGLCARWMLVKDDKQVLEVCRLNFRLGIELRVRLHYGPRPNTLSLKSNHPVDREQKPEAKEFTLRSKSKAWKDEMALMWDHFRGGHDSRKYSS